MLGVLRDERERENGRRPAVAVRGCRGTGGGRLVNATGRRSVTSNHIAPHPLKIKRGGVGREDAVAELDDREQGQSYASGKGCAKSTFV